MTRPHVQEARQARQARQQSAVRRAVAPGGAAAPRGLRLAALLPAVLLLLLLLLFGGGSVMVVVVVEAAIIYIDPAAGTDSAGCGTTTALACQTLKYAHTQARAVVVAPDELVYVTGAAPTGVAEFNIDFGAKSVVVRSQTRNPADVVWDGGGTRRLISWTSNTGTGNLTIEGITFRNGYAGSGGVIRIDHPVEVKNCVAENSRTGGTSASGGAFLYQDGPAGTKTVIRDSTITGGYTNSGGGVARGNGGGQRWEVYDSVFTGNSAAGNGGAFHFSSGAQIIRVERCTFDGNFITGGNSGGGIYVGGGTNTQFTLRDSDFNGCYSNTGVGGALRINSVADSLVQGCSFNDCRAGDRGGAFFNNNAGPLVFENCDFNRNLAARGGAMSINQGGGNGYNDLTIANCRFNNNRATGDNNPRGGALLLGATGYNIHSSTFFNNSAYDSTAPAADTSDGGGAILTEGYTGGGTKIIRNNTFESNDADTFQGGAIMFRSGTATTLQDNTFINNHASLGGAVHVSADSTGTITMTDNAFSGNVADTGGAMLDWRRGIAATIDGVQVTGANISPRGGILYRCRSSTQTFAVANYDVQSAAAAAPTGGDLRLELESAAPLVTLGGTNRLYDIWMQSGSVTMLAGSDTRLLLKSPVGRDCLTITAGSCTVADGASLALEQCMIAGASAAQMTNNGRFSPTGDVQIATSFEQGATGILAVVLGGLQPRVFPAGYDQLTVDGATVQLAGDLEVALRLGFQPDVGNAFAVFRSLSANIAGTFASINTPMGLIVVPQSTNQERTIVSQVQYTTSTPTTGNPTTGLPTTGSTGVVPTTRGPTTAAPVSPPPPPPAPASPGPAPAVADSGGVGAVASNPVYLGVIVGGLVCCCCLLLGAIWIFRGRRGKQPKAYGDEVNMTPAAPDSAYSALGTPGNMSVASMPTTTGGSGSPVVPPARKHEIIASELTFDSELASGNFGRVWKGTWRDMDVAIKELKDVAVGPAELAEFQAEASTMASITPHQHVVGFIGICVDPFLIVAEFAALGALDKLLQSQYVAPEVVLKLLTDVAKGMSHLAREAIIHKDLAARNCLVSGDLAVGPATFIGKVADFGLSRLIVAPQGSDSDAQLTYLSNAETGPLKWMAPESLNDRQFSEKSDVWSFGVTIIECVTGQVPYPGQDNATFSAHWQTNHQQIPNAFPPGTIPILVDVGRACLQADPAARPGFAQIVAQLTMSG